MECLLEIIDTDCFAGLCLDIHKGSHTCTSFIFKKQYWWYVEGHNGCFCTKTIF